MFGRNKPVYFEPYGRRRSGFRVPRWLLLLLFGGALGAGGVVYVQERYLPPRLSASDTATLRSSFDQADAERTRLRASLDETTRRLEATQAEKNTLAQDLQTQRTQVRKLSDDVGVLVRALPPDPRGGTVEVRAGQLTAKASALAYELVLTRDGSKPMPAVVQFIVSGEGAPSASGNVTAEPIAVSIAGHEVVRGALPLPAGFRPRQATIQVLDRAGGRALGMRVLLVK